MLNHSTILLGRRFKRLPESIFKDYVYLNFMKSRCIFVGPRTKVLESNNPQEPCYVFVQYQTRKALEDRMLRALQHPPVFLKTAMAPPKGGKAGEELVKTLGGPTFHSKHCEL